MPVTTPDAEKHPFDIYPQEVHEANVAIVQTYLDTYQDRLAEAGEYPGGIVTPWMLTAGGIGRVQETKRGLAATYLEERPAGYYGLAAHFVKNTVVFDDDSVTRTVGKLYPPYHYKFTLLFNHPVSGGMLMGYNTGANSARDVTEAMARHFDLDPKPSKTQSDERGVLQLGSNGNGIYAPIAHDIAVDRPELVNVPATTENVSGVFADHPIRLRRWAKVVLPQEN